MFDRANATVILRAGEFVILKTQFRVGGSKLALDCQGFLLLKFLSLRYRVCANLSPADMRTPPALEEPNTMLAAPFDQAAILAYYDDYLKKGMFEHVLTHYGPEYVESARLRIQLTSEERRRLVEEDERNGVAQERREMFERAGLDRVVQHYERYARRPEAAET